MAHAAGEEKREEELSAAEKAENEVATEVATQFKRVLDGMRTYPPGHVTLKSYYQGLLDKLQGQLSRSTRYGLKVTPMGFMTSTKVVNRAHQLGDSVTHALYLDGVQHLSIERGVTVDELMRFMELWRSTLDGHLGDTHTFSTRYWEAELPHVHVLSTFTADDQGGLQGAADMLSGVIAAPLGARKLGRLVKEDLPPLRAQGLVTLDEKDLERHEASARAAIPALKPEHITGIIAELRTKHSHQVERALDAVFAMAVKATPQEQDKLRAAFSLVLQAMLGEAHIERLKQNLVRQAERMKAGNPNDLEARNATFTRMMSALAIPQILEPAVAALDDDARRDTAVAILKYVPGRASTLLDWVEVPQTPAGSKALNEVIATLRLDAVDLARRIGWADESLAIELLTLSKTLGPAAWPVRKAAFDHPSRQVQQAAMSGLDKDTILANKAELLPLLSSPVPEVRHALFAPFMATRDRGVASALATLLRRVPLDDSEHKRVIIALGTLGGLDACGALRHELEHGKNEALQCAAAHALGGAADQSARPLLEGIANKLFGGGALKQAAKDALKRLDAVKGAAKA